MFAPDEVVVLFFSKNRNSSEKMGEKKEERILSRK